jgi:hypothetical protein
MAGAANVQASPIRDHPVNQERANVSYETRPSPLCGAHSTTGPLPWSAQTGGPEAPSRDSGTCLRRELYGTTAVDTKRVEQAHPRLQ